MNNTNKITGIRILLVTFMALIISASTADASKAVKGKSSKNVKQRVQGNVSSQNAVKQSSQKNEQSEKVQKGFKDIGEDYKEITKKFDAETSLGSSAQNLFNIGVSGFKAHNNTALLKLSAVSALASEYKMAKKEKQENAAKFMDILAGEIKGASKKDLSAKDAYNKIGEVAVKKYNERSSKKITWKELKEKCRKS